MDSSQPTHRLYHDLTWIWPAWNRPDGDYLPYCQHVIAAFTSAGIPAGSSLLVLACGGGTNVANLKQRFNVTGVDLSDDMLQLARRLNPECAFVQGDMRTVSLGREFDAVLIDDGVGYMTTPSDLAAVFANAYRHLRPAGAMVVTADLFKETFRQNQTIVWPAMTTGPEHPADVVIVENSYDPDPADDTFETVMLFLIRENGVLRIEKDLHVLGLFATQTWTERIAAAGFIVRPVAYEESGDSYTTFVALKPGPIARC